MFTVVGFGNESYGRPPLNFATLHLFFSRIVQNSGITLKMTEFLTDCVPKVGGQSQYFFTTFQAPERLDELSKPAFFKTLKKPK